MFVSSVGFPGNSCHSCTYKDSPLLCEGYGKICRSGCAGYFVPEPKVLEAVMFVSSLGNSSSMCNKCTYDDSPQGCQERSRACKMGYGGYYKADPVEQDELLVEEPVVTENPCADIDLLIPVEKIRQKLVDSALDTQVGGGHYKSMVIQPIKFIIKNKIPYCEGNAIKYVCRHRSKNGAEDIKKAIHYLKVVLEDEYGE